MNQTLRNASPMNSPYENVEFCHGIDANIVKDSTKIIPCGSVKDINSKQNPNNNLYEVTKHKKNIRIFIDIDGEASENINIGEFHDIVQAIENKLTLLDCGVMNSCKYGHIYMDNDGKEKTKNKYSFRLTFHKHI